MTEPVLIKIACVVGAVVAYGLLRWRLMKATHEFRVRVGCEADRLAADPRVGPRMQRSLWGLADLAYRPAAPWIIFIGLVVAVVFPIHKLFDVGLPDDPEVIEEIVRLKLRLIASSITTSPLACVLAIVVLVTGLLVRHSVGTIKDRISAFDVALFANIRAGYSRSA